MKISEKMAKQLGIKFARVKASSVTSTVVIYGESHITLSGRVFFESKEEALDELSASIHKHLSKMIVGGPKQ